MTWQVEALCAGRKQSFRGDSLSAIAKLALDGPVAITKLGLAGDEQADPVHHGGPDMAVHLYPLDHHAFWREQIGDHELLGNPGAFGSNLAVHGISEGDVLLGSRYRLGSALIEACQPRQPCWKIEHRFGTKGMVASILASGRCGWFCRVIDEGTAQAGDTLSLEEEGLPGWTMARLFEALWGTSEPTDPALLRAIADLPPLADKLRGKIMARLDA
ncbi:MOSC domain-containing protein [Aurantiacibacter xanthus]|uniref:MOSC domain-containing protein n=1 Tax=Aurantiacibacter xanthus TaxID=1784712 RepID=A0A3A1P8W2_9SPHN|nr:MOSC domain-containing protein [Aurantiacibacter xanthus]RIV88674.1 MOSC domain-containing protein [Aurantiacibacter xanthus]